MIDGTVDSLKVAVATARREYEAVIRREIEAQIQAGFTPPQALANVYEIAASDGETNDGRVIFSRQFARIARQVAIDLADQGAPLPPWEATAGEVRTWINWLERFDTASAEAVDLCYFAGFSVKDAAFIMGSAPRSVLRSLRWQKNVLSFQLPPLPQATRPGALPSG